MAKKSKEEGYSRSRLPSFTKEEIEMVKGEFQLGKTSDVATKKKFITKEKNLNLRNMGAYEIVYKQLETNNGT